MIQAPNAQISPLYEFRSAISRKLADTAAISQDIGRTFEFVTRLMNEPNQILQDALFTAALITYRRCFNSGTRLILSRADVVGLRSQADEIHDYFMAMADKFAAHSVNPFEQMKAGVFISNDTVGGVGIFTMRLVTFDNDGLGHWANLICLIKNKLAQDATALEAELHNEAKTRSIDAIVRAGVIRLGNTGTDPKKIRES